MVIERICSFDTELKPFLTEMGFSSDYTGQLLREKKNVQINGRTYDVDFTLKKGDVVRVTVEDEKTDIWPSDGEIDIVYEDEYFLVVNKPSCLASVPTIRHYSDNLCSRVAGYYVRTNQGCGIHIINRLDYETKGLVVFAKNRFVCNIAKKCRIEKMYSATVEGILKEKEGIVDRPIYKEGKNKKRLIDERGMKAVTAYRVVSESEEGSFLEFTLKTGRTHQIRLHMASLGHPLTGDTLYGRKEGHFDLCCRKISFVFPLNGNEYKFELE